MRFNKEVCLRLGLKMLCIALAFALFDLFYDHKGISVMGACTGLFIDRGLNQLQVKRKRYLQQVQFRDGLYALSSSMVAGRSIETAFLLAIEDLAHCYEPDTFIIKAFKNIASQLAMNIPVEKALIQLAIETNDVDIQNFVTVFMTTKRHGGSLVEAMKNTTHLMEEKLDVLNHIYVMLSQKRLEQGIMLLLLPLVIFYMKILSPQMMTVMYTTFLGRMVMTMGLFFYGISLYWSYCLSQIEV